MKARTMSAFLAENIEQVPHKEVVISTRIKDEDGNPIPWELQPLSTSRVRKLRKKATKQIKGVVDIDIDELNLAMALESVVFPDLKDPALQDSYGVMGEEQLLDKILLPGEYDELVGQVSALCGYNSQELVDEAKN